MSRELFEAMDEMVFEAIADAGTFTAPGGEPVPVSIFVHRDVEFYPQGMDIPVIERRTEIGLLLSEVGGRPPAGSVIEDEDTGETWKTQAVVYQDLNVVRVAVRK